IRFVSRMFPPAIHSQAARVPASAMPNVPSASLSPAGQGRWSRTTRVRKGSQSLTPAQPLPGSVTLTTKAARTPSAASAVTRPPGCDRARLGGARRSRPDRHEKQRPKRNGSERPAHAGDCTPRTLISPGGLVPAAEKRRDGGTQQILPPLRDALGVVGDDVERERSVAVIGHRDHPTRRDRSVVIGDPV